MKSSDPYMDAALVVMGLGWALTLALFLAH